MLLTLAIVIALNTIGKTICQVNEQSFVFQCFFGMLHRGLRVGSDTCRHVSGDTFQTVQHTFHRTGYPVAPSVRFSLHEGDIRGKSNRDHSCLIDGTGHPRPTDTGYSAVCLQQGFRWTGREFARLHREIDHFVPPFPAVSGPGTDDHEASANHSPC
jgi:hypothetical protein